MKLKIFIPFLLTGWILGIFALPLQAQTFMDQILSEIEKNNTSLRIFEKNLETEKMGNRTGIYLQDPELEVNYLWSDPVDVGNRTDIQVVQKFDFPTAYGYRRQIAGYQDEQSQLEYQAKKHEVLLEARLLCVEIVMLNARLSEYQNRSRQAREMAEAYQKMYKLGEAGILEYQKAQLNLVQKEQEQSVLESDLETALRKLQTMNNGVPVIITETQLPLRTLPQDFDSWYQKTEQNNLYLLRLSQELLLNRKEEQLSRALSLPKASAGYASELRTGEDFRGVTFGLSIPLWENKNTLKYARSRTLGNQEIETDQKLYFYHQFRILYDKTLKLKKSGEALQSSLNTYQSTDLLKKALDAGEISLLEYLTELSWQYSIHDQLWQTDMDYQMNLARLLQFEKP